MRQGAYYNEHDPFAAQWLRELIKANLIAPGEVDERDIQQVRADDLRGFIQCHFFAGIGGWAEALRLAGWPNDRSVWTGSCPCQPYSSAGKSLRQSDERHLWPYWYRLIQECIPPIVFGEQVDEAVAAGWLDDVFHDLENSAYSCASAVLPAYAVNASHERQRLYFFAESDSVRLQGCFGQLPKVKDHRNLDAALFPTLSFFASGGASSTTYPHPQFVGRMMGYRREWDDCAVMAMQSFRSKPKRSSKQLLSVESAKKPSSKRKNLRPSSKSGATAALSGESQLGKGPSVLTDGQ